VNERIAAILKELPDGPGVYQMLHEDGSIIYVGKAKSLRKRVKNYFRSPDALDIKTRKLVTHIADIHYTEVSSESEALLLEAHLIGEHKPKFNILLRDDQRYVYIKITNEDFPQILKVRHISRDGSRYFGPYTYSSPVISSLSFIEKLFSFRNCTHRIDWNDGNPINTRASRSLPCLEYHIAKCTGPCIGAISRGEYSDRIAKVISFLEGHRDTIIHEAQSQMQHAASEKRFEKAASLRDQITDLTSLQEKQSVSFVSGGSFDAVGYFQMLGKIGVIVFQFRDGKLINQENFVLDEKIEGATGAEIMTSFIMDYYRKLTHLPPEVLLPCEIDDRTSLGELVGTTFTVPVRGDRRNIVDLAVRNAKSWMEQNKTKWMTEHAKTLGASTRLALALGLSDTPLRRIECYDISHIQGTHTVGSMVVFMNGKPTPSHYRLFNITETPDGKPDDFASLAEVLRRRLSKLVIDRSGTSLEVRRPLKKHLAMLLNGSSASADNPAPTIDLSDAHAGICLIDGAIVGWGGIIERDSALWLSTLTTIPEFATSDFALRLGRFLLKHEGKSKVYARSLDPDNSTNEGIPEDLLGALGFIPLKNKRGLWMWNGKTVDLSFTDTPDLLVIDGGKGQLSSVVTVLEELDLLDYIPVCSLAKKEEEVFLPGQSESILLPRTSDELYLVQRIRDEAHRFAITAHRNKRTRAMTTSILTEIPGVGPATRTKLLAVFADIEGIQAASIPQLAAVVGDATARTVHAFLQKKQ